MDRLTALLNAPRSVRRLVAVALLVVAAGVIAGLVWTTAASLAREAAEIRTKREQLGNLRSVIALRQVLQNSSDQASSVMAGPEFLQGASEAVIRGNLQSRLSAIATTHGVKILSVGNTPIRQRGNVRYAGLRADFAGTTEAVHATLFDIETSKPYLVIRNATIRSTLSSQAAGIEGPPEVVVQIQFYGALPPASDTTGADG